MFDASLLYNFFIENLQTMGDFALLGIVVIFCAFIPIQAFIFILRLVWFKS